MPVSYHNHTERCGHARGSIDQFLDRAVEIGLSDFGFADHAPISAEYRDGITMDPSETEDYLADCIEAKNSYTGKINVRIGFEVDFPLFPEFAPEYFHDERIDFLIGSCHFLDKWPFDHGDYRDEFLKRDISRVYRDYYSIILEMVESRLFDIIGHFDLIKKFGFRPDRQPLDLITAIAEKCARFDTVIEINTAGMVKPVKEIYPSEEIIGILKKNGVAVTLGSDAHSPGEIGQFYDMAIAQLKKAGYTTIRGFEKRRQYEIPLP